MNPSFRQIAELFDVVNLDVEGDVSSAKAAAVGKSFAESEELGKKRLTEGDYQNAIRHFQEAIKQRGADHPETVIDLAGAYDYGDFELQAYRQYRRAVRVSESAEPLLGLSDLLRRSGRFRDSVAELEKAIRKEPGNPFLHIKLAETLREMGEPNKALEAAEYAVVVKPDESFYHYWVGDLQLQLQRYEDALQSFRAAIELSPGDDFLYLRASIAFWKTDRKAEAIKAIRLASDLDTTKNVYHGLLRELLMASNQLEEAHLEDERAERMDRYDRDVVNRTLKDMGIRDYDPREG